MCVHICMYVCVLRFIYFLILYLFFILCVRVFAYMYVHVLCMCSACHGQKKVLNLLELELKVKQNKQNITIHFKSRWTGSLLSEMTVCVLGIPIKPVDGCVNSAVMLSVCLPPQLLLSIAKNLAWAWMVPEEISKFAFLLDGIRCAEPFSQGPNY